MKGKTAWRTNVGFSAALLLILAMGFLSYSTIVTLHYSSVSMSVARHTLLRIERFLSLLKTAETSQRGYMLTGGADYLDAYAQAAAVLPIEMDRLAVWLFERGTSEEEMLALRRAFYSKLKELSVTVKLRREGRVTEALAIVGGHSGQAFMEQVQGVLANIQAIEEVVLVKRTAAMLESRQRSVVVILLCSFCAFVLVAGAAWFVNQDRRRRVEAQKQLRVAHAVALEAVDARSQFLATMSHEIRTPLNGVIGMTDLLTETPLSEEQKRFVKTLKVSAQSLLNLVNNILDFSKIDAGKLELEKIHFNVMSLIEDQIDLVSSRAAEKDINVLAFVDPALPTGLVGDRGRLGQMILNLLSNAVKFTPKGGEVVVRAFQLASPPATEKQLWAKITVTDTGPGMTDEQQNRLFRNFTQADASIARTFGGTGLGLSIVKGLVQLMHGQAGVESMPGKGSCFWLELPLEMDDALPAQKSDAVKNISLLLADMSHANRTMYKDYFRAWGVPAEMLSSASALVQALSERAYNLTLVDAHLPDMDGLMVAKAIMADPVLRANAGHLVLMTGSERIERRMAARNAGYQHTLPKPLRQSQVYDCLVSHCVHTEDDDTEPAVATPKPKRHEHRILVAEDNEVNQLVVLKQLERLGFRADIVGNGREALNKLEQQAYDLLLLDCHMPELDGYATARHIREKEAGGRDHLTIVALTANAVQGDAQKCIDAGMDAYLSKPLDRQQLETVLRHYLSMA